MTYEEYEDWQYKIEIFLNSECPAFAWFLATLESLDREIEMEDVQDYATSEDFPGRTADVTWMKPAALLYLGSEDKRNPLPDGEKHVRGRRVLRCWSSGQTHACLQGQECKQESETDRATP